MDWSALTKTTNLTNTAGQMGGMLGGQIAQMDSADGKVSIGGQAASTALSFAGAGMSFGPIGALAGGILGGVVGLIKGKKMKEQQEEQAAKQKFQQKWNAAVSSKPNPSATDVSAAQYGQQSGGSPMTYLQNKFGIPDNSILSTANSIV